jgi:hypothetical protein
VHFRAAENLQRLGDHQKGVALGATILCWRMGFPLSCG